MTWQAPPNSQSLPARDAMALLDEWLDDDSGYDEEAWSKLKQSLDRDRLWDRSFFDV